MFNTHIRRLLFALLMIALPSQATSIVNGSFESVGTATASFSINLDGPLPGWTATPTGNQILNCLVFSGATTDICGKTAFGGGLTFWAFPGASPDGGNYVAIDGAAAFSTSLTQQLTGLVVGKQYAISFYQAAAQQKGFTGVNTEQWQVSFDNVSQLSTLMNNASQGDVGWMYQSLRFTATATKQALIFVAKGTPSGQPPFVLLDGVTITSVPEPGTFVLIGLALVSFPIGRKLWTKRG